MTAAQLAERLQARRSGAGWIARCPAHEDHSPSLSIGEGRDGRILLWCFAGCNPEAICAAAGLRVADLFNQARTRRAYDPPVVRGAQHSIADLRGRLTVRERDFEVTVIQTELKTLDCAIARALALAVEGELVQITLLGDDHGRWAC
jgi:putative DNA primase/helicase